jgi:hypothetical protein
VIPRDFQKVPKDNITYFKKSTAKRTSTFPYVVIGFEDLLHVKKIWALKEINAGLITKGPWFRNIDLRNAESFIGLKTKSSLSS